MSIEQQKIEKRKMSMHRKESLHLSAAELNAIVYPKMNYPSQPNIGEEDNSKKDISLVIIGHVDSGKSTLMGHLLYELGVISEKSIQNTKGFKKTGTSQLRFAWATDEGTDERERGVTVEVAYKNFQTRTKNVNAMDAPGHRDFIPNMISGAAAADAALLIIDSGKSAFDSGFFSGGQTREHAILAKTLGVKQIIVCVNKLELFNWQKERFDYIQSQVKSFLLSIGFEDKDIFFIPISGLTGDNLIKPIKDTSGKWYDGPTLFDMIDNLDAPPRASDTPIRYVISDCSLSSVNGLQGFVLFGKLETGVITDKDEIQISPIGLKTKIRSMAVNKEKVDTIYAGQTAEILLSLDKSSKEEILPGYVLSSIEFPIPVVDKMKIQIKTLDIKCPLSLNQKMFLHLQGQKVQITIKKILKIFNEDNSVSKNNSIFIPKNFNAIINIEASDKICAEIYNKIKQLGRICLRAEGETIAVGYILEFI
ncbi:MAG: GTP-binding protein [archaeon]|nr:GTP-binding protein [archaeon]